MSDIETHVGRVLSWATDRVPKIAARVQAGYAAAALELIVRCTPVGRPDTWKHKPPPDYEPGAARGNWKVAYFGPEVPGDPELRDPDGGATIEEGNRLLRNIRPYQSVNISNGLPYIVALENGHSQQAPAGMVALALSALQSGIDVQVYLDRIGDVEWASGTLVGGGA